MKARSLGLLRNTPLVLLCLIAAARSPAQGDPAWLVPHIFGDHMVLQAGRPVPVWGWAEPGQTVRVIFGAQRKETRAQAPDGAWRVELDPLPVSAEPAELIIAGPETVRFHDVLVGEVWLCSGQSNMQKPVGKWRGQPIPTINSEQEIAAAKYPLIRLVNEEISNRAEPARDVDVQPHGKVIDYPWKGWVVCSPATLDEVKFSAVGYFFARKIFTELKIPVGMIEATAGGTHIEAWTPRAGFESDPALAVFARAAATPMIQFHGTLITTLYNGMIHPLIPFALRGVLWYQGESNLLEGDGAIYTNKMDALILSWRAAWGRELPFYFVQLPDLRYSARVAPWHAHYHPWDEAVFREAQGAALRLPKTGMVVTTDVGDLKNMHPPHKREVGERLARWALFQEYGRREVEPSGPLFRRLEIQGSDGIVHFSHVGQGLVSADARPLTDFTLAGDDGVFHPASAQILGDTVVVRAPEVDQPRAVRFGWDEASNPNLFNRDGLPAAPFRTDGPVPPSP
jgi:sialate O-acetylesterase